MHVIAAAVLGVAVLVLLVQAVVPGNPSDLSEPAPNYAEDATDGDQISEAPATPTVVLPMSMAAEATPRIGQFLPQTATSTATASSPTATVSVTAALQSRGQLTVSPTSTTATPVTATVSTTRTATPTPSVTPTPTRSATPTAQSTQPPQPVTPIGQGPRIHVVDYGESLSAIAERYGTTVNAIASANGLDDTSYVFTGQRLIIP
ncbi:MAG: LysM domain-containing protein [Chloroflexota bacterium]|nr:MAG: LysM domain-containing protein [Chloroflexota bacterium]